MAYYDAAGNELISVGIAPPVSTLPYTTVPPGALAQWQAAKGAASSAIVPVAGLGDSILRGGNSSAGQNRDFWYLLVSALQARYGSAGEGFHSVADTQDNAYSGGTNYSPRAIPCWTYSAGWQTWITYGVGGQAHVSPAGGTATGVFNGTAVDVIVAQYPGGAPFTVRVDGTPYDQNGVANGSGGNPGCYNAAWVSPYRAVSIGGLAAGQHTIVLTCATAGGLALHGITAYSGAGRGILPLQMAFNGRGAYSTLANTTVDSAKASIERWGIPPRLVILEHIVNDMQNAVPLDAFFYHARRVTDSAKVAGASVLHVIPFIGPMTGYTNSAYAHAYIDRVYALARRQGSAVLDINAAWEDMGPVAAAALVQAGNWHPLDNGHADIAARLQALLL